MKTKKTKCPICGSKMKNTDGNLMCDSCGYFISAGYQEMPQQANLNTYSYDEDHAASTTASSRREKHSVLRDKYTVWKLVAAIAAVISVFGVILSNLMDAFSDKSSDYSYPYETSIPAPDGYDDMLEQAKADMRKEDKRNTATKQNAALPESEIWQQFISQVFDRDYNKVSADELAQIISLRLYNSDNSYQVIEYTLSDGQGGKFFYNNTPSVNTSDLRCFPNLELLDLGRKELNRGDLDNLRHLRELHCGNSPAELAGMTDPKQFQSLYLSMNVFSSDLLGIEAFSKLSHLSVAGNWYLTDISALSSLNSLTSLEITDGDTIDSFQVLYDMPWLEELSIDSQKLRDIGFVSGMPGLTELTIQNSAIKKLDALGDCGDTLTRLDLSHNYQVTDYDIVSEMTHLTDLTLFINYSFDEPSPLPDFSNMPDLKHLSIGNYDSFDPLVNAAGLEELTIKDVYTRDLSAIAGLTNLKRLNLFDMSLDPGAIAPIMNLTQLEVIDMTDSYIWGNVEGLLKLPNLKELNLNDCTAGFDMENLAANESLTVLRMNDTTLKALENGKWDYNADNSNNISMSEHTDMFQYYPNLTELYLSGTGLDNVAFAADLTHLMFLDITDNYVTDLSPLADLPDLRAVMCAANPIAKDGQLGNKILSKN